MSEALTREEKTLLSLLCAALTEKPTTAEFSGVDLRRVCAIADAHAVLPLLCPTLDGLLPPEEYLPAAERCTAQYYRLLFLTRRFVLLLRAQGINCVVLKGAGAAWYYPVPEHRKSGDIDLLLARAEDAAKAEAALLAAGAVPDSEQHANHHLSFHTPEGIELELHTDLTEDFDNRRVNALTDALRAAMPAHTEECAVLPGVTLPVPDAAYQAISLLLHMLQHFLRSGFGLKLLCDWTAFWNRCPADADMIDFERFLDQSGLDGFSDMVSAVCIRYLGMDPTRIRRIQDFDDALCRDFLREIFDAEEFGKTSVQRMVMVRGGFGGYVREFHHQMRLNYPRASRCALLWPALWILTLWRFLRNNRVLRRTSLRSVLQETSRRSRITEPLHLFERR